ncbi:MAG: hypothetical protein QNJ51_12145 [Calothrix sp. MO_167.B12]|nr:hypothetical protein [Calothrix sp. MO_167.B12]
MSIDKHKAIAFYSQTRSPSAILLKGALLYMKRCLYNMEKIE